MSIKDKKILIFDTGSFFETALKLADYFQQVYYYCAWESGFPGMDKAVLGSEWKDGKQLDTFDGKNLKRVLSFYDYIDEVDVILFTDVYWGDLQEYLRNLGYNVFGCGYGSELELDRWDTAKTFKENGMDVASMKKIIGIDALKEELQKVEDKYIKISRYRKCTETFHHETYELSLPIIHKMQSELGPLSKIAEFIICDPIEAIVEEGIDSYTVNGEYPNVVLVGAEIKDAAYAGAIMQYKDLSKGILKTNKQISPLFKECQYKGFFSTEVRSTKDDKNYLIDMTCFSEDTEVLTNNGWKLFKDCVTEDKFATLNIETKEIEYQYASNYIEKDYIGKMIHLSNKRNTFDSLVTPDHDILRYDEKKRKLFKQKAKDLNTKGYIPRTGVWKGKNTEFFELPSYHKEWDWNSNLHGGYKICTKIKHEDVKQIKMIDWASFMGWYLSEGSNNGYIVSITQSKRLIELEECLKKLPFNYSKTSSGFQISSVQLCEYLNKYGLCNEKYIPDYILNANKEIIESFLYSYWLGDGSSSSDRQRYFTTSKKIVDGLQECILKVGSVANIRTGKGGKGSVMSVNGGKEYIRNHDLYIIERYRERTDYWFETTSRKDRYIHEIDYNGKVYCVTVPNGTLYVRRNGKPTWSGNCREPQPPSHLYCEMFANLGEIIYETATGNLIDVIPNGKYGLYATITSDWYDESHQAIYFPPEIRDNVKLNYPIKIDGNYYCLNINNFPEVGALVCCGDSFEECKKKMEEMAPKIKGYGISIKMDRIDKAIEEFSKMQKS